MEFSIKGGSPEKQRSGCVVVGVPLFMDGASWIEGMAGADGKLFNCF